MPLTENEYQKFCDAIYALGEVKARMRDHERRFIEEQEKVLEERGGDIRITAPQWNWIEGLVGKYCG